MGKQSKANECQGWLKALLKAEQFTFALLVLIVILASGGESWGLPRSGAEPIKNYQVSVVNADNNKMVVEEPSKSVPVGEAPKPSGEITKPEETPEPEETEQPEETTKPSGPKVWHKKIIRQFPGAGHKVAITFDDGPRPEWTERYLRVLEAKGARATFFVVGAQAPKNADLVRAILASGNEVGNHSWSHSFLGKVPEDVVRADISKSMEVLEKITGQPIKYFRPPYGSISPQLVAAAESLGVKTVTWSIDPRDWAKPLPEKIVNHVMNRVQNGSIILLHEGHPGTLVALPLLINKLQEKGYELVTLSELLSGQ
ncbi:MAG: hypothetical protein PWP31_303 [Clostridia bacterium]|nr:hypothetical protein [Clostridia bacterium]